MVLLIGESIGWQELIVIGILALIVFGPRKLPELGRKFGKIMAEFRRATGEFKATWESEVSAITNDVKEELNDVNNDVRMLSYLEDPKPVENSIGRNNGYEEENGNSANGNRLELPTVKQVEASQFEELKGSALSLPEPSPETSVDTAPEPALEAPFEPAAETKKDWL